VPGAEALLVAEIADLTLDVPPPPGVAVQAVADEQGVELATTTPFMHPGGAVS
jgi:hypothetical protein